MTRSFICTLIGVAMTLFAWYGPWAWPAWPAFTVLDLVFGGGDVYGDLSNPGRGGVLVVLIVINVAFWALISYLGYRLAASVRSLAKR